MKYKISQYAKKYNVSIRTVWNWIYENKLKIERTQTNRILIIEDEIQYSFSPSTSLEKSMIKTIETKQSPLVNKLEINLENKINSTYKGIV